MLIQVSDKPTSDFNNSNLHVPLNEEKFLDEHSPLGKAKCLDDHSPFGKAKCLDDHSPLGKAKCLDDHSPFGKAKCLRYEESLVELEPCLACVTDQRKHGAGVSKCVEQLSEQTPLFCHVLCHKLDS